MNDNILWILIGIVVLSLAIASMWQYGQNVKKGQKTLETSDRQLERQEKLLDRIERLVASFEERQRTPPDDRFRSS